MKISMKQFFVAAFLFSMFALSGHSAGAQGSWKLKEIRVFNNIGSLGTITSESYDASGGDVEIQISGDSAGLCPGGFEKVRFTWRFPDNISEVRTGGGVGASLAARQVGKSQNCRDSLAAGSYIEMHGSSGSGSGRYFSSDQYSLLDSERFLTNSNPRVYGAQYKTSGTASVKVNTHAFNPKKTWGYFEVYISTPTKEGGGSLLYVYLYENTGGSSTGGGRAVWGPTNYSAGLNGATLTYYRGTTHQQCQADCEKNPKCKGFTLIRAGAYSPNDPPMCYLMSEATSFAPSPCCISAIKNESGSSTISSTDDSNAFSFNNGRLEETLIGTLLQFNTSYDRHWSYKDKANVRRGD